MIEIYLDIKNCFVKLEYAAEVLKILPDDKCSSFDASCDGGSLLQFLNDKKVLLSFLSSIFFRKLLIFPVVCGSGRLMKETGEINVDFHRLINHNLMLEIMRVMN